jgi:hypothetical protein
MIFWLDFVVVTRTGTEESVHVENVQAGGELGDGERGLFD